MANILQMLLNCQPDVQLSEQAQDIHSKQDGDENSVLKIFEQLALDLLIVVRIVREDISTRHLIKRIQQVN